MADNTQKAADDSGNDFLPDLCSVQSVLGLILVSELLVMALLVSTQGLAAFDWARFGVASMLVLWIVLSSAGCLCALRPLLAKLSPVVAGAGSYVLTLLVTLGFSLLYELFVEEQSPRLETLLGNVLVAAVIAGITLRYLYLQQQLRNQQKAEMMARIQALQSRIRPHFLFNSMNSIASLISIEPEAAERMVVDLSRLFRASLKQAGLVPLKEEIALCQSYIDIEQIRMGERLQVDWQYQCAGKPSCLDADEFQRATIPSFLLQPLVENAIYHGIQPLPDGGTIAINIVADKNTIAIAVNNPVADRQPQTHHKHLSEGNGMALDNIRHRLSAYYENRAELKVNKNQQAFSVSLRYPAQNP